MPANLPPQYHDAEKKYRQAGSAEEKTEALREMLAVMPKHKGTEKLQADLKRRLSQLKEEGKKGPAAARQQPVWVIEKIGAGQVPIVGSPNAGKSALVDRLTAADVRVAEYPFATPQPTPAMMPYENIQIQLIDTPPYARDYGVDWMPELVRRADACVVVADLSDPDTVGHVDYIVESLQDRDVVLVGTVPEQRSGFDIHIPTLLAANKRDTAGADPSELESRYGERFPVVTLSAETGEGLEEFKRALYDVLHIVRVFTKAPGKDADKSEPFILERGSTVRDLAGKIHKDFLDTLKYARLWGSSGKFQGQRVGDEHVLEDGDTVELHTR